MESRTISTRLSTEQIFDQYRAPAFYEQCNSITTVLFFPVERIYLRFAMIESDEQLQKFTDAYLIRLIETAGAEPKAVTKVYVPLSLSGHMLFTSFVNFIEIQLHATE